METHHKQKKVPEQPAPSKRLPEGLAHAGHHQRVVLIGPTAPYRGGIVHFNSSLANTLQHQCTLLRIGWSRLYPEWLFPGNSRDPSRQALRSQSSENRLDFLKPWSWWSTLRRIDEFQADLVVLHWVHPIQAPIYWILLKGLRRRACVTRLIIHNAQPHEALWGSHWLARPIWKAAQSCLVHSHRDAEYLQGLLEKPRILRAFHPVYDAFQEHPRASRNELPTNSPPFAGPKLLFFGFIRPYKGLDVLLQAMAQLLDDFPTLHLVIAGESFWKAGDPHQAGSSQNPLGFISELGLQDHIHLVHRYIPNEEVAKLFEATDWVVLPYRSASQSGILQLAYAFRKPVIATRTGGLPEAVVEGQSGFLAEPGSVQSLRDTLHKALQQTLPPQAVEQVAKRFSWSKYAELLLQATPAPDQELGSPGPVATTGR